MKVLSVGIVDDHSLFREGIGMLISQMQNINLQFEASSGKELLTKLHETDTPPDVILLDIEMEDMNGIATLEEIRKIKPHLGVIILSMHTEPVMMSKLMKLGANGYLRKDAERKELEIAIRTVVEKGEYINEFVANALLLEVRGAAKKSVYPVELTSREKEVLNLICQEFTTSEIGEKLFISERTVEGHRKSLCSKLDVKNVAGLVKRAILLNLIDVA